MGHELILGAVGFTLLLVGGAISFSLVGLVSSSFVGVAVEASATPVESSSLVAITAHDC